MTKKVNGQSKGKNFEREACKHFEDIFGIGFRRTPGSGAYVGGQNRGSFVREDATDVLAGDLIADTPEGSTEFPFSIEAKSYNDEPKFHHLIQGDSKTFDSWIEQAEQDAEDVNKWPIIIFKLNRKGTYIAVRETDILKSFDKPILRYKGYMIMSVEAFKELINIQRKHWSV